MDAIVGGLEKTYGKTTRALDGMTFSVPAGQVFGLLGPNGAGKSTAVRILVTLSTADAGSASVAGHDVRREAGAVRRALGYVPQSSGVDREGTGLENLVLQGRLLQGMRGPGWSTALGSCSSCSPSPRKPTRSCARTPAARSADSTSPWA